MEKSILDMALDISACSPNAYDNYCAWLGVSRLSDAPIDAVREYWKMHCLFTRERASRLILLISEYNRNHLSRQINAGYSIQAGELRFSIVDRTFSKYEMIDCLAYARSLGVQRAYATNICAMEG